jgi:hypothetical protein
MEKIKIISIIILTFVSCSIYSQAKKNKQVNFEDNANCVRSKKIDFKNRLKMYPFGNTTQIIVVSHRTKNGMIGEELQKYLDSVKIGQDSINLKEFEQHISLNLAQIEKLTDVIFNYSHKGKEYAITNTMCYQPRNAIIFLDNSNKILGFIEICFGCNHLRTSDKRIDIGDYCEQKYDLIKDIFRESGIKYGITEVEE